MKYTVIESLYKHETETKIARRHKLCVRIIRNFDYSDLNNLNFLHISKILKVERKTLYNYFPEKEELLVVLALCLLEDIHKIKYERVKELKKQQLSDKEYIAELLYNTLDSIVFFKKDSLHYLKQFDSFLVTVKSDLRSQKMYNEGVLYLKQKYGILEKELRLAIDNNIIVSPVQQTSDDIIFTIIESGYSYQNNLLCNKNLSNSDISKYLLQYIQVLVYAYTSHE